MAREFEEKIQYIIDQMYIAGYDPYLQLAEYIKTHDIRFITRKGNARMLAAELDYSMLVQYFASSDVAETAPLI